MLKEKADTYRDDSESPAGGAAGPKAVKKKPAKAASHKLDSADDFPTLGGGK